MRKIRIGTFETNSSSTHSLVMFSDEEMNKWMNGSILYNVSKQQFINTSNIEISEVSIKKLMSSYITKVSNGYICNNTFYETIDLILQNEQTYLKSLVSKMSDDCLYNFNDFCNNCYDNGEIVQKEYITGSGEMVHAISIYTYE